MATFTISENFGTYGNNNVSVILDGSTSATWQADAKAASGKYVMLTSDELIHVNSVKYYTGSTSEIFGTGAYLQVSLDGSSWTDIAQFNGQQTQTFTVDQDAQYIRIYCKSSGNYVSIAELTIDYGATVKYTISVQVGDGITIDRSAEEEVSGGQYVLTINGAISSITDNGSDVSGQLEEHTVSPGGTASSYPTSVSASGSISGTRYKNCVGKGSSTTATGNDYASGGSSSQATITYKFDFSEIPAGATIKSVSVKVGGHAENASRSTANLQLYSGDTAKGSQSKFTSTSKQVVTMTPGSWTRDELQDAQLRFTIGYYGGLVNGVDFDVEYELPGGGTTYHTYTIASVAGDHTILINMGGSEPEMWVQINMTMKKVEKIWKQENGQIVEISPSDLDQNANYHIIT